MIVKKIKKLELIKKRPGLSFNRATIFMLIFATIGGFIIWRSFAASSVGDLNGDGNVDILDLSILLSHYGTTDSAEDINTDGKVDIFDLSVLLSHYGQTVSSQKPTDYIGLRLDRTWTFDGTNWVAQDTTKSFGSPTNFANSLLPDNAPLDTGTIDIGTATSPDPVLINPSSPNEIARQVSTYGTYVNLTNGTAPVYIIPANTPLTPVECTYNNQFCVSQMRQMTLGTSTTGLYIGGGIPIPDNFVEAPATDTDAEAVFYQPGYVSPCDSTLTGRMYEVWKLRHNSNFDPNQPISPTNPKWTAGSAGRVVNLANKPNHYIDWYASGCKYTQPGDPDSTWQDLHWGVLATGIFIASDQVSREDCQAGQINHEVGLLLHNSHPGHRWPAQRDDGGISSWPVQEGMRLRLPANLAKPNFNNRLVSMLFDAAQKYGLVIDDKTNASVGIRIEPQSYGVADPACSALYDGQAGYNVLSQFPWSQLKVLSTGSDTAPNG